MNRTLHGLIYSHMKFEEELDRSSENIRALNYLVTSKSLLMKKKKYATDNECPCNKYPSGDHKAAQICSNQYKEKYQN